MIVGVSMNIANAPTTGVVAVTYNGLALSFVGAHNDAGNTRRVEMWYLLAPADWQPLRFYVSVNIPGAQTVGVVAGVTTFTGVDQTVPLGTFVSADGAAAGYSAVGCAQRDQRNDSRHAGYGRRCHGRDGTGPQVSQWNLTSREGLIRRM